MKNNLDQETTNFLPERWTLLLLMVDAQTLDGWFLSLYMLITKSRNVMY
jgi:hypothetical protein